jgi:hypothetical protein
MVPSFEHHLVVGQNDWLGSQIQSEASTLLATVHHLDGKGLFSFFGLKKDFEACSWVENQAVKCYHQKPV